MPTCSILLSLRRAALWLEFRRPDDAARGAIFTRLLEGANATDGQIRDLVKLTARSPPYTFSDLTDRVARIALRQAWKANEPFSAAALKAAIAVVEPSPLMETGQAP